LGKTADRVPDNYERGELLVDTAMDLETNATTGLKRANSLLVRRGELPDDTIVKMAQTFRSGTNDIDAIDYVEMFLENEKQTDPADLNDTYVLENFRPVVTKKNWRMDCGVAGYDNTFGLPPFFPTHLRCEDYIYRLWVQQPGICSAHVDAAQNHGKSNYMRNPPAAEILNEEVSNLLKRKVKDSVSRLDELGIAFDYDGEVTAQDAEEILQKIQRLHAQAISAAERRERDQGLPPVVADAGGDLLFPARPQGVAADAGEQSTQINGPSKIPDSRRSSTGAGAGGVDPSGENSSAGVALINRVVRTPRRYTPHNLRASSANTSGNSSGQNSLAPSIRRTPREFGNRCRR
jgi:hypothetical protein